MNWRQRSDLGGLRGREVQPEPCAGSRGDEETIYWAPAQGWTARPLNWEADNLFIKAGMWPHYPNWLLALIHSQFKVCLVLSHEYNRPLMRDTAEMKRSEWTHFWPVVNVWKQALILIVGEGVGMGFSGWQVLAFRDQKFQKCLYPQALSFQLLRIMYRARIFIITWQYWKTRNYLDSQ